MAQHTAPALLAVARTVWPEHLHNQHSTGGSGGSKDGFSKDGSSTAVPSWRVAVQADALLDANVPPDALLKIRILLWLLSTRLGTLLLCGTLCITRSLPFVQPFCDLPPDRIERILALWACHWLPALRNVPRPLVAITMVSVLHHRDAQGQNPVHAHIGSSGRNPLKTGRGTLPPAVAAAEDAVAAAVFTAASHRRPPSTSEGPPVPPAHAAAPVPERSDAREACAAVGGADDAPLTAAGLRAALVAHGLRAGAAPGVADCEAAGEALDAVVVGVDVVIVGSGAGGGVSAAVLARAGLRVLVVEAGAFVHAHDIPTEDDASAMQGYEGGGLLASDDTGMVILAGRGLGGGTRINWGASFQTPPHVRREWAEEHGLPALLSDTYTHSLTTVCTRLGVHVPSLPDRDPAAVVMRQGLEALGKAAEVIPQNCSLPGKCSKYCSLGCPHGGKQDALRTWLADAVDTGNTSILTRATARRIITCKSTPSVTDDVQRPSAVQGALVYMARGEGSKAELWRVLVRAPVVFCSAGALHTPALLLRSKITERGNVGRNLRLHPATFVRGYFPEGTVREREVRAWEGPMMALYSLDVARWQHPDHKYGPIASVTALLPSAHAAFTPFLNAEQMRSDTLQGSRAASLLLYTRDSGTGGTVTLASDGGPAINYHTNAHDQRTMLDGVLLQLRVLRAAGARRFVTLHRTFTAFELPPRGAESRKRAAEAGRDEDALDDEAFESWLGEVERRGAHPLSLQQASAHQMGTARMGGDPKTSAVCGTGESWEVSGLYVADGSLFPTASGVNPMITIEALCHMVAEGAARKLTDREIARPYPAVAKDELEW